MRWEAFVALAFVVVAAAPAAASFGAREQTEPETDAVEALTPDRNRPGHVYHTWETLTVKLQQLTQDNPGIVRLHPGGESVLGLELWVVEIADFEDPDRKPLDQREVVWLDGGTHANEQLGTEISVAWIEFLVEGYGENETATWIVENRHTFIMPMVNPDGNHQNSRWNAHQVNINRNYPVGWRQTDEDPVFNNPGPYPASEPETQAILDWWAKTEPDYMNSFHTGFDGMLYPWAYPAKLPPDQQVYRRICQEIDEPDPNMCGPTYQIVGPTGGGSIDTSYKRWGSISFAYELGDESGMYASVEDPRTRLQRYWDGLEHAFLNVEKYGAHPVIEGMSLDGDQLRLTVHNDGYGNLTEGQVTIHVPGAEDVTRDLGAISDGARTTLDVSVPVTTATDGRVEASLTYQERQVSDLTETRTHALPVAVDGDELVEAPLDTNAAQETIEAQSADDANSIPGPALGLVAVALAAAATARGCRGRPRGRDR